MNDTKEHILKVSLGLFLQKSFKEVTMKELVEKTGMSKGAFYHYFESKEQLFLEVVNNTLSAAEVDYSKFNKDSLYQFYHEYLAFLHNVTDSLFQTIDKNDTSLGMNYFSLVFDAIKLFPSFKEQMLKSHQVELGALTEIVHNARSSGEINSFMNDEQIASIFIFSNDGLGLRNIMNGRTEDIGNSLAALWDSFYKGLKA